MITLKNVDKMYSPAKKKALEDLSLEINDGEFFCIVGSSGGGKTTILKLIAGLESPSSGQIDAPGNIGMVFQLGALFPWDSVEENIAFGPKMKGIQDYRLKETVHKYIDMVGLSGLENKYPRELSGGQRQRVGIARALAVEPDALLLDEPFSALDPLTTEELQKDLLRIWHQTRKTIVMVSHLLEEAVLLADRVAVVGNGKLNGIITVGLERPRDNKKEAFLTEVEKLRQIMREK